MKIGFFGLTHLGLNYLAASAAKGFKVVGFDHNDNVISKLNKFEKIINEPNLFKNIKKFKKNIIFTNNFDELKKCKIIFISSDVKTDNKGKSDIFLVKKNIKKLCLNFKHKNIIVLSQVFPGFCEKIFSNSNSLYYQVETLIFGNAFERAKNPERIILGCKKPEGKTSKYINIYYKRFKCPIIKTNYRTAELVKISINLFLISSVTTTNLISKLSKKIGASWNIIEQSLRLDKRIGEYAYLKPGLGITGGNLERDLFNIISISKKLKLNTNLFNAWKEISYHQKKWIYDINNKLNNSKKLCIGILGLTYKENTDSIKNSISIELIKKLKNKKIYVFDPAINNLKNKKIQIMENEKQVISNSDILFVLTEWKQFKKITLPSKINKNLKIIIDPYGVFFNYKIDFKKRKIKYLSLTS